MNKRALVSLLLASSFVYANEAPSSSTSGIHIVPLEKQDMPVEIKKELLAKLAEEKEKGYQVSDDPQIRYLMNIRRDAISQPKASNGKNNDVYDTHLKSSYTDIKLSFPFSGIKKVPNRDVIGYAAVGAFEKNGWSGIREFFVDNELGNCSYSYMKIKAAELAKETTEYLVSKKPSNKIIEGNVNDGFLYTVNWYTNDSMSTLECANKSYKPDTITKMIAFANEIDSVYVH